MNPIQATNQDKNNLYSMGTINLGGTPAKTDINAFNQSMVNAPAVVSNYNTPSKVFDITKKAEELTGQKMGGKTPFNIPQEDYNAFKNANPNIPFDQQEYQHYLNADKSTQPTDYSNAPSVTKDGGKFYYNQQTGAYDIPDVGANTGLFANDPYSAAIAKNIQDARTKNDAALASALEGIKNRFEQYRTTQKNVTGSGAAGAGNALLQSEGGSRGSVAQFAAATADRRVETIMADGQKALMELDNKEKELISATQAAYAADDFKYVSKLNDQIEQLRTEKLEKSKKVNDLLAAEQKKANDTQIQASRDNALADLYSQGITDPTQLLQALNETGGDFTLKEINEGIKNLAAGLGTDVTGLDQTTKEFYRLKQVNALPPYVAGLGTEGEQLLAYVKARTGAETKGKVAGASTSSGGRAYAGTGTSGAYANDMEALGANARSMYKTKFAQEDFDKRWNAARDEADKIAILATAAASSLTGPERDDFTNQSKAVRAIDKAIQMLDQDLKTGVVQAGKQYVYNTFGKDYDPKLAKINQLITSAIQPYRSSITGAAWGDQEDAEYQNLFGSTKYSPEELKQRLQGVKDIMKDNSLTALNSKINPISTYSNPFESTGSQYIITSGDELRKIADQTGTTVDVVMALNPGINPNNLLVGSRLNLPIEGVHKDSQDPLGLGVSKGAAKDPLGLGI